MATKTCGECVFFHEGLSLCLIRYIIRTGWMEGCVEFNGETGLRPRRAGMASRP